MVATLLLTATAAATPPKAPPKDTPPDKPGPVELRLVGHYLRYSYDLSSVFDDQLWAVVQDNGYSEITVEVRLLDAKNEPRVTQYHTLKVQQLEDGRLRLDTGRRKARVYSSRKNVLRDLANVRGKPIRAHEFAGETGHLEITVLVNPVQVFAFPDGDVPVADREVVPQTFYDRKMELRSEPVKSTP